ncbi:MAG: hypothetical protein ACW99A_24075, partial [Candidatus Kariarchaeaceae archaeon]
NRFTIKLLLELRNPSPIKKITFPRISLGINFLGQPVGEVWSSKELVLEPFTSNTSHSAGLLPLYITLFVGGEDTALPELIVEVFKGNLGAIELDVTVYLGDFPVQMNLLLGDLLGAMGGGGGGFGLDSILEIIGLGGDGGGGDIGGIDIGSLLGGGVEFQVPSDYMMLYNTTTLGKDSLNKTDIRALMNVADRPILSRVDDCLIFGAKEKFGKIHWVNGTEENVAVGDGNYTWQYWNGNWTDFPAPQDPNFKFNETKDITFDNSTLTGWTKRAITDFWDQQYYYVQCKVDDVDTSTNLTMAENSTAVSMAVNASYIQNYKPPNLASSSGVSAGDGGIEPQSEIIPQATGPQLRDWEIPVEKGLLKTDMELEDYFLANGIKMIDLAGGDIVKQFVLDALQKGYDFMGNTPDIYVLLEAPLMDLPPLTAITDINSVFFVLLRFVYSHNLDLFQFLGKTELDVEGILQFIGEGFTGWTAPQGIDVVTGENIYLPISETTTHQNSITFSYLMLITMIVMLAAIAPYKALKRKDQSFVFKDIKNLPKYIDKVKIEMEKGITTDEIELLKTATFKKKSFMDSDKKSLKKGD